ncbi:MAG: hypothetical protein OXP66_11470 [Candidatus Tectomicrobia bacterium]|nr:hypothetical protein [Candidatus Tectomicrobia bacterium]
MTRWIAIALVVLLAGCGSDRDSPEAPGLDLTGRWVTTEIACETSSYDLPAAAAAGMNREIEQDALASPGVDIEQDGSDLVITDPETGRQSDGTIEGDTVRYVETEEGEFAGVTGGYESTAQGTVVDADTIEGTVDIEWEFTDRGLTVQGETACDARFERVSSSG